MLLLVQPEYPPAVGGMQTHAAAMASGLCDRGHRIAVITYAQTDDPHAAATYDAQQPFPTYRCLGRLSYWGNIRKIRQLCHELQPTMIYCSTPFYGLVSNLEGIPTVCRSVGTDITRCWIPYPFHPGSKLLANPEIDLRLYEFYQRLHSPLWLNEFLYSSRRELVGFAARSASALVANSHYTRDRLLEVGADSERISIVSGGVDAARFAGDFDPTLRSRLGIDPTRPLLLTVCRLVMKKGVDVLLQAVALARQSLPELALLIVGDGPEKEKCQHLAGQLGLKDSVRFIGRVPHHEVAEYYHAADCFVLASRIHKRRKKWADVETMGRVICEANAAGIPVIASETGGIPSLIRTGDNGLLVPSDDPAALATAIVSLWHHPSLRAHLGAIGIQRAREEFDWKIVVDKFVEIFRRTGGIPEEALTTQRSK